MPPDCSNFEWSSNPGAYEAQLIRRCGNPYFPSHKQAVSYEELSEARRIDREDCILAQQRFEQLASAIKALPATMSATEFHGLRERIEDVIKFSMGAGGRAYDVAAATYQIREALIAAMRQSCAGDERTLAGRRAKQGIP